MKKDMTDRALAANRQNATKSSGPTSAAGKMAVGRNALKHGLLAKKLWFRDEQEQTAFGGLLNQLIQEHKPQGVVECALVEEIAVCLWKIAEAGEFEARQLGIRNRTTKVIMQAFAEQSEDKLPLGEQNIRNKLQTLECKELLLRMAVAENQEEVSGLDDEGREQNRTHIQVEARLGSSLDTTLRYISALKRDLYRAIDKLESLQRSRIVPNKDGGA